MQKSFINKKFNPKELEEISDEKITDFVNNSLKDYSDYASMFNTNNDNNGNDDNNDNQNKDDSGNENKDDVDQVVEEILK